MPEPNNPSGSTPATAHAGLEILELPTASDQAAQRLADLRHQNVAEAARTCRQALAYGEPNTMLFAHQAGRMLAGVLVRPDEDAPGLHVSPLLLHRDEVDLDSAQLRQATEQLLGEVVKEFRGRRLWSHVPQTPGIPPGWQESLESSGFHHLAQRRVWCGSASDMPRATRQPETPIVRVCGPVTQEPGLLELISQVRRASADAVDRTNPEPLADAVARLLVDHTPESHQVWLISGPAHRPDGYVCLTRHEQELWVYDMGVSPEARGQGVAGQLIHCALSELAATDADTVHAMIDVNNEPSIRCFEALGLRPTGLVEDVWFREPHHM